jgi:hypothetical protein
MDTWRMIMNRKHTPFAKLRKGLADLLLFYPKICLTELTMMLECRCRTDTVNNSKKMSMPDYIFPSQAGITFSL